MKKNYIILMAIIVLFASFTYVRAEESFDIDEWQQIRNEKEKKIFEEEKIRITAPESLQVSSATKTTERSLRSILSEGIEFPYDSKLEVTDFSGLSGISGRKYIGMKYSATKYLHKDENNTNRSLGTGGFELNQQLQVRVKGTIKKKITVNVDYDDTVENKKDISIMYKGDPDELVQEAAFGDISLSLPGTEFVSYNKAAFGAMARLKYRKANLYGVFSRTKGTTVVKRFRGATTFETKEIMDTSYLRRKYYRLNLDPTHLPIKPGSEKIYFDDRIATNNTILTSTITVSRYGRLDSSFTVTAELLSPGKDYSIDYEKGRIVFRKLINQNYIIAVDYEKADGTRVINDISVGSYKMIKDESETLRYELKNYYSIGHSKIVRDDGRGNFIFRVLDLNRTEVLKIGTTDVAYPNFVEVDFEAGIFRFTDGAGNDREPFPESVYVNQQTNSYKIYTEYRYKTKSYNLSQFNIIPQSEKVLMDGKILVRDQEYFMDYDSGYIEFFNTEKITDSTLIEITYEYAPFGGQMDQTVVGIRGEYNPFNNISLGSTLLYNFPAKPLTSPDVRSTPESISVYEFDTRASFTNIPLQPVISGEYAGSERDLNTFGNALVENMEGVKQADTMPTDKDSWKASNNPFSDANAKDAIIWDNIDVKNGDINPNPTIPERERDSTQQVLSINYKLNFNKEASIIYPISRIGVDYTKKLFLDFWMHGDNSGDNISIALGSLNEDSDNDGILDTEDKNSDGILNPGEDIGITFNHPDGQKITIIGANNGKIDTEDFDGEGTLRTNDNIFGSFNMTSFNNPDGSIGFKDETGAVYNNISWSGWKHFIVPLGDVTNWDAIKQIRITVKSPGGNSIDRNIQFSQISLVGNKWEKPLITGIGEMIVTGINNFENSGYTPLYDHFPSIYKDLYNLETIDLDEKKEQALSLKYTLDSGSTATTKSTFRVADYSKHKEITYFLWGDNSKGATFVIQFGAESAYYEHQITPNWLGWKKITLYLVDLNKDSKPDTITCNEGIINIVGIPSLTNISQIKILVRNDTGLQINDGEIWINEIYLDQSQKLNGYAHRENIDFTVPDWASFGGKYRYINRDFQTLTTQISNQDHEEINAYFSMPQIWLLKPSFLRWISAPLNTSVSKVYTVTPSAYQTGSQNLVSVLDEGKVVTVSGNTSTSVTIPLLPRAGASYSKSITDSNSLYQRDDTNTFNGTLDYVNPLKIYVTPNDVSASYSRTDAFRGKTQEKMANFSDLLKRTTDWDLLTYTNEYSGRTNFTPLVWTNNWFGIKPFSNLSLTPNYRFVVIREKKRFSIYEEYDYPKSDEQTAGLSTSFSVFPWFQPSASYNININQTYDLTTSTNSSTPLIGSTTNRIEAKTKTVVRTANGTVSISLTPRDILDFKPLNTLSINSSYDISDGDSYDKVGKQEYIYNRLWIRKSLAFNNIEAKMKSQTISDTYRTNARWLPFEFLKLNGRLSPINTITTSSAFSKTDTKRDETGTKSRTVSRNWPDISAGISETEKILFIDKYLSDTQASIKHSKRTAHNFTFGREISFSRAISNSYDYRFNLIRKFDCYTSYSVSTEFNLTTDYNIGTSTATSIETIQEKVTGDLKSQNAAFQVGFRVGDWRFTPRYDWRKDFSVDGTPSILQDSVNHSYSMGINYDVSKPITWKIPFTSTILDLKNRLTTTSNIKYSKIIDNKVANNNTDAYSLSLSADYTISDNLKVDIGSASSLYKNRSNKLDDYYTIEVSAALSIAF